MTDASTHIQPGILEPVPALARYLTFTLVNSGHARAALQAVRAVVDGHSCVVGLSESLVESLDANIPGLRAFPSLAGAGIEIPATQGALWCWLRGDDRGVLLHTTRTLSAKLAPAFELTHIVDAFKFDTQREIGRDLTGYEDGTENPQGDDAIAAAIVAGKGRGLDGSSFVAVQQWRHDLQRFDALATHEQDHAIGRRKSDNEEIDDAPESAHVKRTAQESFSPEAFVVRRSMPWAEGTQCGLVFVAFGHSFDAYEAQLKRMAGLEDGITDAIFTFTRPVTGNFFWCPPMRDGKLDLSALGLS